MPRYKIDRSGLGQRVNKLREQKSIRVGGYTLYRLAKDARVNYAQLHRIIRGKSAPSRDSLIRICRALGCSREEIADIFACTEYREPDEKELEDRYVAA